MNKTCKTCDRSFEPEHHNSVYCSIKCRANKPTNKSNGLRWKVLLRDEFRCVYCGMSSIED